MPEIKIAANVVVPKQVMRDVLDRIAATAPGVSDAGVLNGAKVCLFQEDIEISADTTFAALDAIKADFNGYAASSAVAWGAALTDDNGKHALTAGGKQFTATNGLVTNLIYGAYITDGGGTDLLAAWKFDAPVEINEAGDGLIAIPVFPLSAL